MMTKDPLAADEMTKQSIQIQLGHTEQHTNVHKGSCSGCKKTPKKHIYIQSLYTCLCRGISFCKLLQTLHRLQLTARCFEQSLETCCWRDVDLRLCTYVSRKVLQVFSWLWKFSTIMRKCALLTPVLFSFFLLAPGYSMHRGLGDPEQCCLGCLPHTNAQLGFENLLEVTDWVHACCWETSYCHYPVTAAAMNSSSNCSQGSCLVSSVCPLSALSKP